jgi:hypothetical protein
MQCDPGHIHGVGVCLDQDGKVIRQLGKNGVAHRSRPPEVEAAEVLDNTAALRHHPLRISAVFASTAKAEVGFLTATCGGGTCVAVQAAGDP